MLYLHQNCIYIYILEILILFHIFSTLVTVNLFSPFFPLCGERPLKYRLFCLGGQKVFGAGRLVLIVFWTIFDCPYYDSYIFYQVAFEMCDGIYFHK